MRLALWHAWHVANWSRAKKLPNLQRLMRKIGRSKPKRKTPEQLLQVAKQITALMRGRKGK